MGRKPKSKEPSPYKLRAWRDHEGLTLDAVGDALGMTGQNYGKIERGGVALQPTYISTLAALYKVPSAALLTEPAAWFERASGGVYVPIIGQVGADPEGRIIRTVGQAANDSAPLPAGATSKAVAVEVNGHSMGMIIEDGSLIYFENQQTPPSEDLVGEKVVVQLASDGDEVDDADVLVKILRRGADPGRYDLESINGPTLRNVRVRWAAEIISITPPRQARRLIRRGIA